MKKTSFSILTVLIFIQLSLAQERPFIWVTQDEREQILNKIENNTWAKNYYDRFIHRLDYDISLHQQNPDKYLRGIPFDWENAGEDEPPPFFYTIHNPMIDKTI